jgi:type VI secretion system secreted protein Hcp
MVKKLVSVLVALVLLASTSSANAALMAYLRIKGQKSGEVKGSITQKGREGMIGVIAVDHDIVSPRDAQSGLPTGQRMHKPLRITKELDQSTPILANMMATNENIPVLELRFWRPGVTGQEQQYYTVKLTNATISEIHTVMPNIRNADGARLEAYEEVAFTYQKIEWVWTEGGIVGSDSWTGR